MDNMTEVQRALWLEWVEAEKKVSHLTGTKPTDLPDGNWLDCMNGDYEACQLRDAHRDAMFDWRTSWNEALGYRDGLRKACCIAKVPNFVED